MHIGEKIKMVRRLRSLTQEELSNKINKTRAAISFIEQTGKVNHYTLKAILKILNISEDDLLNFDHKAILMREPTASSEYNKAENDSLKTKIESLTKEMNTLKALVKSQKKLIAMLEKHKK